MKIYNHKLLFDAVFKRRLEIIDAKEPNRAKRRKALFIGKNDIEHFGTGPIFKIPIKIIKARHPEEPPIYRIKNWSRSASL